MNFLKQYWFGLFLAIITSFFVLVFIIVLFAPRQDELKRGFIPCTEKMAEEMLSCESNRKVFCMLKAVVKNNFCDIDVIGEGLKKWLLGEQKTPWANYYFTPQLSEEDEGLKEYLDKHPNIGKRMQELRKNNLLEEVEHEQQ